MRKISRIVVHTTDTYDHLDIGADRIRRLHVEERGWDDIGYHYVVRRSGRVEDGRPVEKIGAHAKGYNRTSIGIVWVGQNKITEPQQESLYQKLEELLFTYYLAPAHVVGHYELNARKTCPNLYMPEIRANLTERLKPEDLDCGKD